MLGSAREAPPPPAAFDGDSGDAVVRARMPTRRGRSVGALGAQLIRSLCRSSSRRVSRSTNSVTMVSAGSGLAALLSNSIRSRRRRMVEVRASESAIWPRGMGMVGGRGARRGGRRAGRADARPRCGGRGVEAAVWSGPAARPPQGRHPHSRSNWRRRRRRRRQRGRAASGGWLFHQLCNCHVARAQERGCGERGGTGRWCGGQGRGAWGRCGEGVVRVW